ncbi:MAG: alpha-glucan family phosphorylase [Bacteroidota bacterium]|nr:alpha-glucan family phosphorylase [Bacteroidota bacterium]
MRTTKLIFETSWEICNKIDGVHTVIAGKSKHLADKYKNNYILIGPDVRRSEEENPEFEEDPGLHPLWKKQALKNGLRFRIGRWRTEGNPIVILVDFSNFISQKNDIFARFWEHFKLDSMSGEWDYIEAAIFGYASGKIIESFANNNLSPGTEVLAHFHDWQSAAGLLYLKYSKQNIATVFTAHSLVLSKTITEHSGNLYSLPESTDPYEKAKQYDVTAQHSMETIAAKQADVFTVNGSFIGKQAEHFLNTEPTLLTPNGLDIESFNSNQEADSTKGEARNKLDKITQSLLDIPPSKNRRYAFSSGEYDLFNKGIELIIESAKELNAENNLEKELIIFLLFPADNYGPRQDLKEAVNDKTNTDSTNHTVTHFLHQSDYDDISTKLQAAGIRNQANDKVKIIYCPAFLDGNDGIFNIPYHKLIAAFDLAIFPYYYEAWGYTVHEAIAGGVPATMSSNSGFGTWLQENIENLPDCIRVIDRSDDDNSSAVKQIKETIKTCTENKDREEVKQKVTEIARKANWTSLLESHIKAYDQALQIQKESGEVFTPDSPQNFKEVRTYKSNKPIWRDISVQSTVSKSLKGLEDIAGNLWWSWNPEAQELFKYIAEDNHNPEALDPKAILKTVSYEQLEHLENDKEFKAQYEDVYSEFKEYMNTDYDRQLPSISYFSMEYGLTDIMQIYSGGLGILAGDYLKQASDSKYNMKAVGLFYRQGYFTQQIGVNGEQIAVYDSQKFIDLPAKLLKNKDGVPKTVQVAFPGRVINIQIWEVKVGRISLYLLDTDREDNSSEDRAITHRLYGGNNETRLKQEMVLGIGGIRALNLLNIDTELYHMNEGHAAFISFERMTYHMNKYKMTFNEAKEVVRSSSLFTTHTPVPAGHDSFHEDLLMTYMGHYPNRLRIPKDDFVNLGRQRKGKKSENFSMSVLGVNFAQEVNGVSKLHGEVTRNVIFPKMWEGYFPEELHIGYVTNGVHQNTWTAQEWQNHFKTKSGEIDFTRVKDLSDKEIMNIRTKKKKDLFNFIIKRLDKARVRRNENPKVILDIQNALDPDALTIGFARRFAAYKRGDLLFRDLERLSKILNNPKRPVQLLFAGKAHPKDDPGQDLIKRIIAFSKQKEFIGKVLFLEDYKMSVAKYLVQGVDIWLNTPTRPMEASGTSGMKAVMNGVMNFSVLDGWWLEGYVEGAGWAISEKRIYENQDLQDDLDAAIIYQKLEEEIVPLYYDNKTDEFSEAWVQYIRKCLSEIAPNFRTLRMINDYYDRFYKKESLRSAKLRANDFAKAQEIARQKLEITKNWEKIETENIILSDPIKDDLVPDEKYHGELTLNLNGIPAKYVGAELIMSTADLKGKHQLIDKQPLELIEEKDGKAKYKIVMMPPGPGNYSYAFRLYPTMEDLPHRQDIELVKWV